MSNLLQRFQAWLESTSSQAEGKELDVSYNLGLKISNESSDTLSSDTSSQQETPLSSDTSSQPEHSSCCQVSELRVLPKPTMPFKDDTASIISATVGIAAAEGGLIAATEVVAVIDTIARCVASVPGADAKVTANIVTNCIANYTTAAKNKPGLSIAAVCEQARDAILASSMLRLSDGLVLESIRYALSYIETWEANSNLPPAIVYAVTRVANSVAILSGHGDGWNTAEIWSDAAHRALERLRGSIARTGDSTPPFPDRPSDDRAGGDRSGGEFSNIDPGPGDIEAVLQTARLRAAIGVLQNYTENAHVLVALNALDAVASGDLSFLYQRGRTGPLGGVTRSSERRNASLQANQLEAALYALWTYNTNMGNHEVVGGLAAVAAGAGLQFPPEGSEGL